VEQQVAVVTGISSGLGRAVAAALADNGYRVFGTVRSAGAEVPRGVEKVVLDVRDEGSVQVAVAGILSHAQRIDVLVNNAGVSMVGAIEEADTSQAQALFDVNFFGAVRVTKAVLPAMRAQRKGLILFMSSLAGLLPAPFMGFYAASKHALEGYCESLDHEVRSFGIRAVLVEPGFMKTSISRNSTRAAAAIQDYAGIAKRAGARIGASVENGEDPSVVARTVLEALRAAHPRLRYPVGKNARMTARLRNLLPARMFDRSVRRAFRLDA